MSKRTSSLWVLATCATLACAHADTPVEVAQPNPPVQRAQPTVEPEVRDGPTDPALRSELLGMLERDRAAREQLFGADVVEAMQAAGTLRRKGLRDAAAALADVDGPNGSRLWEIIESRGRPDAQSVGSDGVAAFAELCLHTLHDEPLAKTCLVLVRDATDLGELDHRLAERLHERVCARFAGAPADIAACLDQGLPTTPVEPRGRNVVLSP